VGSRAAPEEPQAAGKHARAANAAATAGPQSRPVFRLVLDLSWISGGLIGRATMRLGMSAYKRARVCLESWHSEELLAALPSMRCSVRHAAEPVRRGESRQDRSRVRTKPRMRRRAGSSATMRETVFGERDPVRPVLSFSSVLPVDRAGRGLRGGGESGPARTFV
jgi:hypothetical protein